MEGELAVESGGLELGEVEEEEESPGRELAGEVGEGIPSLE